MKRPYLAGSLLFLATVPIHLLVSESVSIAFAAVTLAVIAGAYLGFGAADGRKQVFLLELAVAVFFALGALGGLVWLPHAIPAALALHAIWDVLHHDGILGARVPRWYIPLCVVFDVAAALFLFLLYLFWF